MAASQALLLPTGAGGTHGNPMTESIASQQEDSSNTSTWGKIKEYFNSFMKQDLLSKQKPWAEVVDRSALSKPTNISEALGRIKKNTAYFRVNYIVMLLVTCAITFIFNPSSLLVLGILAIGWLYLLFVKQSPLEISGRQISEREKFIGMSVITFVTIFFLTSVGTVFLTALGLGLTAVLLHGAFREPDNLFVDDIDSQQSFFNILTGNPAGVSGIAHV